jgi:hypothetical protein
MTDKTIADVLDKSVDKLSGGAAEIAKAAKQMAPHAWEVAVRQQVAEGWMSIACNAAWIAFVLAVATIFALLVRRHWARIRQDDDLASGVVVGGTVGVAIALLTVCFAVDAATDAALKIANPEYYAAKALLGAAK